MVLTVGYDRSSLEQPEVRKAYRGEVKTDRYGRRVPKHAHGTANLGRQTSSTKQAVEAVMGLYEQIVDKRLLIRRIQVTANHVVEEGQILEQEAYEQMELFTDYEERRKEQEEEREALARERRLQKTMLEIKKRYGKNAILKGMNLEEGATARDRNNQIGGHKA